MAGQRVHNPEAAKFIAERVKHLRKEKGLSQTELGKQIGLSYQQIQKYETGATRITVDALAGISAVLDMPPGAFFPRTESKGQIMNLIEEQLDMLKTEAVILETIESGIRGSLEKLK